MKKIFFITLITASVFAYNPNGRPGLLTISLDQDRNSYFTLPIFNWMTLKVSKAKSGEGYSMRNLEYNGSYYEFATIYCSGTCNGASNEYVRMYSEDIINLGKEEISFSLDFHVRLW